MKRTIIHNATIVNDGITSHGHIIIEDDRIADIQDINSSNLPVADIDIDATGCVVIPGVIDTHVHFREPGLTHKADIMVESRAAAYGGVTSYFDMPNTVPQTTALDALEDKFRRGAKDSHVNYSFFFGATNDNTELMDRLDFHRIPGIKLFMGSSTGNMLVDKGDSLNRLFAKAAELDIPVMAHCEDTDMINEAMEKYSDGDNDIDICLHPAIRSAEACYASSSKAVALAEQHNAHLHLAHITTAIELNLLKDKSNVTAEVTPAHLLFTDEDYRTLGARIKCNPAVKTLNDRNALRQALADGTITTIGTDHAPHLLEEKQGGARKAVSGMPMLQFSLVSMLALVDEGVITIERMVELMAHNPAKLFAIKDRGFIRKGYKADIAIVRRNDEAWTLTGDRIQSKCGWSPLEGRHFHWSVVHTLCNGHHILNDGSFDEDYRGEAITFER